jgi:hypothetical protein
VPALALSLLTAAPLLAAAPLYVTRTLDALDCPEAAELARAVNKRAGRDVLEPNAPVDETMVRVQIGHEGFQYLANIEVSGPRATQKVVGEFGGTCAKLAGALTQALTELAPALAAPTEGGGGATGAGLSAQGGVTAGPLGDLGPTAVLRFDHQIGRLWWQLAGSFTTAGYTAPDGSRGHATALEGSVGVCVAALALPVRLGPCLDVRVGHVAVDAAAYGLDETALRLGLGASLGASGRIIGALGWTADAGAELPLTGREARGARPDEPPVTVWSTRRVGLRATAGLRLSLW